VCLIERAGTPGFALDTSINERKGLSDDDNPFLLYTFYDL
jgi:hypothetical protein